MKKIFISNRRDDSAVFTGRLFDRLINYFGRNAVFLDIDSISIVSDFRKEVSTYIKRCDVFVAIIGTKWEGQSNDKRRIDNPDDFVRIEIEEAIALQKPIVPVYWDDFELLKSSQLPSSLKKLVHANAFRIGNGRDFDHHIGDLRIAIAKILYPRLSDKGTIELRWWRCPIVKSL